MLAGRDDGEFVVRDSSTQPGNFALSYKFEGQTKHIHIENKTHGLAVCPYSMRTLVLSRAISKIGFRKNVIH